MCSKWMVSIFNKSSRYIYRLDNVSLSFRERDGNRSFRTQVISYPSHFVPFWSFRTHFYFQFGHFVPISYPVWSYRTYFYYFLENRFGHFLPIYYCFVPKSFRTRSHFVSILVISYPGHFVPTSKLGTNWLGYEMTFFFAVICYFQTRYELTLVWNDFLFFSVAMCQMEIQKSKTKLFFFLLPAFKQYQ